MKMSSILQHRHDFLSKTLQLRVTTGKNLRPCFVAVILDAAEGVVFEVTPFLLILSKQCYILTFCALLPLGSALPWTDTSEKIPEGIHIFVTFKFMS